MKQLTNIETFYNAIESGASVIYFYTTWCPDCYKIEPHLPRLEEDFKNVTFYSFDRDKSIDLAKHLKIYGVPSFLVYKDEEEIGRFVTKNRKTYLEVKTFLDKILKG